MQLSLLVQTCTVLVVADATAVGWAFQQRIAGIIWVGLIFPAVMIQVIKIVFRLTLPMLATAINIETKYKNPLVTGLITTFVGMGFSYAFLEQLSSAALHEHERARMSALLALRKPPSFAGGKPVRWALYAVMVFQGVLPLALVAFCSLASLGSSEIASARHHQRADNGRQRIGARWQPSFQLAECRLTSIWRQ